MCRGGTRDEIIQGLTHRLIRVKPRVGLLRGPVAITTVE
jgi:hypothetical protein